MRTTRTIHVGLVENRASDSTEIEALPKPTLETLAHCFPIVPTDGLDNIQFATTLGRYSHSGHLNCFYTWLIFSCIDASVVVDGQALSSTGFTEALLELAASSPSLKYALFSESPFYSRASFNLLMLSRSEWCDYALHNLSQRIAYPWHRDGDVPAQYFDKGYQFLVRDEYLRAISEDALTGERLVRVAEVLGERCHLQAANFARTFEYEFLVTFLEGFTHKQLLCFGDALSAYLDAAHDESHIPRSKEHRYFLGFWALERLDSLGIDLTNAVRDALRESLFAYYHRDFESCIQGAVSELQPSLFFSTLPWHRLVTSDVSPVMALSKPSSSF